MNFPCAMAGIFALLFAMPLAWWYGSVEGKSDYRKIIKNADRDTLKEGWHKQNAIRRGVILAVGSLGLWWVLVLTMGANLWALPAVIWVAVGLFGVKFTTQLNTCRKLNPWYVSYDARASYTDKFMVRMSAKLGMLAPDFSRLIHYGFLLAGIVVLVVACWYFVDK